ncbi:MAG: GNAT family N-acetyltransferase [Chitinophagaceae bacterium]|nr:MAG: GNAT family N-acetyltransferase [Chitinophagaceae bacterium]
MNACRYIEQADIDKKKWDSCILQAANGLVYSTSLYLDMMADNWDAVILNDYEAVLPLPWRKKWGISYVYPPAFTQQMGITAQEAVSQQIFDQFIAAIPAKFRYLEMNLNNANRINGDSMTARKNYLLDLGEEYSTLQKNFSRSASRNIKQALNTGISVSENVKVREVFELHRHRFKEEIGFSINDYDKFLALLEAFTKRGSCYCIGAENKEGQLIAGSIYIIYKSRLYFVINGNTEESLQVGATHLLMDHTIRSFSAQNYILDFEGSDHPSFARFYEQYGANGENYFFYSLNRLPWPIKWLKQKKINPVSKR